MRRLGFLVLFSLLYGCGQTGPLYMPGEAPVASSPEPAADNIDALDAEDLESVDADTELAEDAPDTQD